MTFPFERVATAGEQALATWGKLKKTRRGVPVVFGNDESVGILAIEFDPNPLRPKRLSLADTLPAAQRICHPENLVAERIRHLTDARAALAQHFARHPHGHLPTMSVVDRDGKRRELTREETRAAMLQDLQEPRHPPVGEWPAEPSPSVGLSVAKKYRRTLLPNFPTIGRQFRRISVGAGFCFRTEYDVAALRSWRDRFGAELIGLSSDRIDLRVASRPNTREQALELAREHYVYCSDIVDQGEGTLSNLAARLLADNWWNFWWD